MCGFSSASYCMMLWETFTITFISYGQKGIRAALFLHFPNSERRACMFHLSKNFVKYNKGTGLKYFFNHATSDYCISYPRIL